MLVNPMGFIQEARQRGVAIASFNVHNLETIQAVAEGAAAEHSPVIIQTTPGTLKHAGARYVAAIVREAAKECDVPMALHLDHCTEYDTILRCMDAGYTSVMIDTAHLPYEDNVAMVRRVVAEAHSRGVAVEGELGRIGGVEDDLVGEDVFTVPEEARDFVSRTGIDMLAIAIGTAHGEYKGEPNLDFERLSAIRAVVDLPLILHGASGVPDWQIRESMKRGICKINIATELKIPMAQAIRDTFAANPGENDPRRYMGNAKKAVTEVVRQKIRLCGASGMTDEGGNVR